MFVSEQTISTHKKISEAIPKTPAKSKRTVLTLQNKCYGLFEDTYGTVGATYIRKKNVAFDSAKNKTIKLCVQT